MENLDHLKAKNDGRKKAWFLKKIEELEGELAKVTPNSAGNSYNEIYAEGFISCMHNFQILNKVARNNLRQQIIEHGPGAIKKVKQAKFRGFSL